MPNTVVRTRTECPDCGNTVATKIVNGEVIRPAHRLGTRQPQLCRPVR